MNKLLSYLDISEEIIEAIDRDKSVVALESAVISNGLPYPHNLNTALECESIIRNNGCIPATLAVIDGRIKIGLSNDELERISVDPSFIQMSRKDLPFVVANNLNGVTTVASSIIISRMVGIKILATAGIGGVHRRGNLTFDISRDLQELATNNICVVCSGPKAILDIGLTLEYLETYGVPIIGYKTDLMPSFYTRDSGHKISYSIEKVDDLGRVVKTKWDIGLTGGVLVVNPIPEEIQLDRNMLEESMHEAFAIAEDSEKPVKDPTSIFLDIVEKKTGGQSLYAHMGLIKNNAEIASKMAHEVYRVDKF